MLPALLEDVNKYIVEYGITAFIVGNYGGFDHMATKAVVAAKKQYPEITLSMLTPCHPTERPMQPPQGFDNISILPVWRKHHAGLPSSGPIAPLQRTKCWIMLNRVETALGDEWKKQTVTEVSDLVYSDDEGNTIIYYVCVTTYYEADPNEQNGLNTDAIVAVINPDKAESCRECTVTDLPAAIYRKDGRAYLYWTIIPELSCVIEYDPAVESESDIFRMAESVPANTSK